MKFLLGRRNSVRRDGCWLASMTALLLALSSPVPVNSSLAEAAVHDEPHLFQDASPSNSNSRSMVSNDALDSRRTHTIRRRRRQRMLKGRPSPSEAAAKAGRNHPEKHNDRNNNGTKKQHHHRALVFDNVMDFDVKVCHFPNYASEPYNFETINVRHDRLTSHIMNHPDDILGKCNQHCHSICDDNNVCTVDYDLELNNCNKNGCYGDFQGNDRPLVDCYEEFNLSGNYVCDATVGNHGACVDVDECTDHNIVTDCDNDPSATCVNYDGSYTCECLEGYYWDTSSQVCMDRNECRSRRAKGEPEICGSLGTCQNTDGSYFCYCQDPTRVWDDAAHDCVLP